MVVNRCGWREEGVMGGKRRCCFIIFYIKIYLFSSPPTPISSLPPFLHVRPCSAGDARLEGRGKWVEEEMNRKRRMNGG